MNKLPAFLTGPAAQMGAVAVFDQALVSGTSFITALVLARHSAVSDYGAFVLGLSTLLVLLDLQSALIIGPMLVLGAGRQKEDAKRYLGALVILQCLLGILLVAALAAGTVMVTFFAPDLFHAFFGLAAAIFFIQAQEFLRRIFFMRQEPGRSLTIDLARCLAQLAGLAALWRFDLLTGRNVFFVMGAAACLCCVPWTATAVRAVRSGWPHVRASLKEQWAYGRWTLAQSLGVLLIQTNTFIVAGFGGTASAAMLEATRLLLAPAQFLTLGGGNVLGPRAAAKYAQGGSGALRAFLSRSAVPWIFLLGGYLGAIALFPNFWLEVAFGTTYAGAGSMVVLWCLVYLFNGLHALPGAGLCALRRPDLILWPALGAAIVTLVCSFALAPNDAARGGVVARMLGEAVFLISLLLLYIRFVRRQASERMTS